MSLHTCVRLGPELDTIKNDLLLHHGVKNPASHLEEPELQNTRPSQPPNCKAFSVAPFQGEIPEETWD